MSGASLATGPVGKNRSEADVIRALSRKLAPGERLLPHVRLTNPAGGDVEIDVLLMLPGYGFAVVEIKGGVLSFMQGEWTVATATGKRRVHPTEQARNGKHALRAFLSRQEPWLGALVHTEWFIAAPFTEITGDMGPEAIREVLIGAGDLDAALDRIKQRLQATANSDPVPTVADVERVYSSLLTQSGDMSASPTRRAASYALVGATTFVTTALLSSIATAGGASGYGIAVAVAAFLATGLLMIRALKTWRLRRATAVGVALVAAFVGALSGPQIADTTAVRAIRGCEMDYSGCLPRVVDLDCTDVAAKVRVIGKDVYGLDKDGDGVGCEWNGG